MQIYKICPHCGKKLFLIYELELAMYFAKDEYELHKKENKKDPETGKWPDGYEGDEEGIRVGGGYSETIFPDRHVRKDWDALIGFFHQLQDSHGPNLYAAFDDKELYKIRQLEKSKDKDINSLVEDLAFWLEPKVKEKFLKDKIERSNKDAEEKKKKEEDKRFDDKKDWRTDIHRDLTNDIKRMWIKYGFDYDWVKAAINTNSLLGISDYRFAEWLRDKKGLTTADEIMADGQIGVRRAEWQKETGSKPGSGYAPPPPPKKNLRSWHNTRALTEGEWTIVLNSNLAFIASSYEDQHQFTIDEAHEEIKKAEQWSPSDATTPPTWTEVLQQINNIYAGGGKFDDLATIDKFLAKNKFLDPMIGINLAGVPKATLLNNFNTNKDEQARNEIKEARDNYLKWNKYEPLNSTPDGNCFFNAFSIYLAGNESLATRLRVAVCLGLLKRDLTMKVKDKKDNRALLKEINDKLPSMSSNATYEAWRNSDDIIYVSSLLKRPIRLLYRIEKSGLDPTSNTYAEAEKTGWFGLLEICAADDNNKPIYDFAQYWTIYHRSKNHYIPLIHPTVQESIGPEGKQDWGEVDIGFIAEEAVPQGKPIPITVKYVVDKTKVKIIGAPGIAGIGEHPNDTKAGNLNGYELKEVVVGITDIPSGGIEQIKNKGNKKVIVRMKGKVRNYTDGDNSLTFETGVEVRHNAEGPKTFVSVYLVSLGPVSKLADPNSYININIIEKALGQSTPGKTPDLWPDETKYNGKDIKVIKLLVNNADYNTRLKTIQDLIGKKAKIHIESLSEASQYIETTKALVLNTDFNITEITVAEPDLETKKQTFKTEIEERLNWIYTNFGAPYTNVASVVLDWQTKDHATYGHLRNMNWTALLAQTNKDTGASGVDDYNLADNAMNITASITEFFIRTTAADTSKDKAILKKLIEDYSNKYKTAIDLTYYGILQNEIKSTGITTIPGAF